jgi:hypothetical protein
MTPTEEFGIALGLGLLGLVAIICIGHGALAAWRKR